MRLKSIEIKGFKSFADKTILNFDNNITGVVGPNGCGKSNVVDAIRWVLGEQKSKTLRLEKMDNIIFNGSKDKTASNIAEVSLVLENTRNLLPTEFSNVTITRTIHRDGDSDYKLNGVNCRLKDIKDLFMDTGISTDSYAIIELKMIDEILSDTDNARRRLIEQAAGVSKYKQRKKETLQKLESTEADLNRVEDLLAEIEKNLKALESQARKARQYKSFREEYKVLSIDIARYQIAEIYEQYQSIASQIKIADDKALAIEAAKKNLESNIEKEKLLSLDKEKGLSEQQKLLNNILENIRNHESKQNINEQQAKFLSDRCIQINLQLAQQDTQKKNLHETIEKYNLNLSKEQEVYTKLVDGLKDFKEKVEIERTNNLQMRSHIDKQRNDWQLLRQKIYEQEKILSVKTTELQGLEKSQQQNLFEEEERSNQLLTISKEIEAFQVQIQKQKDLIAQLEEKEEKQNNELTKLEQNIEKQRNDSVNINRQLDAKHNEYKLTKNMIDSLEGFPESIKYLKKQASWLKDTPLLSDIIYTDEKYRVAIESLLQPYLTNYIVEEEVEAVQAIELLKNAGVGKANFLILAYFDSIKINTPKTINGVKAAIDILEVDAKYKNILAHLLRGIYIADNDKDIYKIYPEFKKSGGHILISETGNVQINDIQVSGGSVGLFEGKRLGRQKNLEKLSETIKVLENEALHIKNLLQQDQQAINTIKNNSYKKTIEREKQALNLLDKDFYIKKSKLDNYKEVALKNTEKQLLLSTQIEKLKADIKPIEEATILLKNQQIDFQAKFEKEEKEMHKLSDSFSQLQQQYNQDNLLAIQKENLIKSIIQSITYNTQQIEQIDTQFVILETELKESTLKIENLREQISQSSNILIELIKQKEVEQNKISSTENDFFLQKERIQSFETQVRQFQNQISEIDKEILAYKEKQNDSKMQLNVLKERLSFEFKLDITTLADENKSPELPKETLVDRLNLVKRKIENFGDVNPMAEEAYNEIKERHDFIIEQKNDLITAKVSLIETISEIENTAKNMFMTTFMAVRENFISVFRSMFTMDDSCDLVLENPEDPLESAVDIIAKPKGKRPQSINQLSGGEKTLTSLSLLFGLYLYKPAPFCILDEVDAPLDDTNIKKFNDAIRSFSKNSQFIIVTHNKNTMAAVDAIYGVTMIKQGISRVVPVDFSNLN